MTEKKLATKSIIVARKSTKRQKSEDWQLEGMEKYAEKEGLKVLDTILISESGWKRNRKQFEERVVNKLANLYEEHQQPMALIVWEEDRLTRRVNSEVMNRLEAMRAEGKVEYRFAKTGEVLNNTSDSKKVMMFQIKCSVAEEESSNRSEKVKERWRHELSRGHYPAYSPTGYLNIEERIDKDTVIKKIIYDKERKPLIKQAFELYSSGDYSVMELSKIMRNKGLTIKPKKAEDRNGDGHKPLSAGDVLWILKNPFYTGRFYWRDPDTGERKLYKGTNFKPIISERLYEKVQRVINEKSVRYSTRHSTTKFFKFRGLLTCFFCGCKLTPNDLSSNYANKKPGEEVYYRCSYAKKSVDPLWYKKKFGTNHSGVRKWRGEIHYNCPQLMWKEQEIEEDIKLKLKTLSYDEKVYQSIREKMEQEWGERITINEAQKKGLEAELREKERLKKGLVRRVALEDDFQADFEAELREVNQEMEVIKTELRNLEEMEDSDTEQVSELLNLGKNLHKQYDKLPDEKKRQLLTVVFDEITLAKGEWEIGKKKVKQREGAISVVYSQPFRELWHNWVLNHVDDVKVPVYPKSLIKNKDSV